MKTNDNLDNKCIDILSVAIEGSGKVSVEFGRAVSLLFEREKLYNYINVEELDHSTEHLISETFKRIISHGKFCLEENKKHGNRVMKFKENNKCVDKLKVMKISIEFGESEAVEYIEFCNIIRELFEYDELSSFIDVEEISSCLCLLEVEIFDKIVSLMLKHEGLSPCFV